MMQISTDNAKYEVKRYLERAHQALKAAEDNISLGHYSTAINRAYYAIFYAANALLATKGLQRSKHSGVIAAFRQHFVKTGLIEVRYSDDYGDVMDYRMSSDYEITVTTDEETAVESLDSARRFAARAEIYLKQTGYL